MRSHARDSLPQTISTNLTLAVSTTLILTPAVSMHPHPHPCPPQCVSPRGGSSAPCDYEVMGCRGGLTCAPDRRATDSATCTPIYSLPMGSSCANSSSQYDSGAEACELGTFCSGGVCTPYEDVVGCSSAADCNYPMGYCKCFSEGSRCVPFRNTACKESMDDLAQCMAARNCNFDNDVEAWAFPTPASCIYLHCSAQ